MDSIRFCKPLLKELFKSDDLDNSQKVNFLVSSLNNMDEKESKEYLDILELDDNKKVFEPRTRPKYIVNTVSEKLLKAFKEKGWINDFLKDQDREGHYKIIRNKPKSLMID